MNKSTFSKSVCLFFFFLSSISFFSAHAQVNDECINAIELNVGNTCNYLQYTNFGATASQGVPAPGCASYQGGDVWFKAVIPANGTLELNSNNGDITDGGMAVYTGNCNSLTLIACDDDGGNNGLMPYLNLSGLTVGSTVYIRFWEYDNDVFGTFSICAKIGITPTNCTVANPGGCSCPTAGATDCNLIPDIIAGKHSLNDNTGWFEFNQLINDENKGLLRVDVSTPNVGWGPMEVSPTNDYICGGDTLRDFFPAPNFLCPDGGFPKRLINQRIYHKVGNTFQFILRPAGFMQYHPSHGHIHLDGWGLYTLRLRDVSVADTLQWPIVNSGVKVSFCLIDLTTCSGSQGDCVDAAGNTLINTSFPNYGLGDSYNCGNERQGISVGKVDIYHHYLDESFVKIPYEACNGDYHVVIQIDPDDHFLEMNENNNWLAAKTPLSQQRTSNTGAYAYIFSNKGNISCSGETLTLEASGASSYQWSTGATSQKISVNQPGRYWVRATTPCGTATSDTLDIFSAGGSSLPTDVRTDTVCRGGNAHLYANGNAHWYDAPTGGNLLFVGNDFTTGTLNSNSTFYVADQPATYVDSIGPVPTNFSGAGTLVSETNDYLIFNAFLPFILQKVTVNAASAGVRNIQLRDIYGKVLVEKQLTLNAGIQELSLNFYVPSGLNLQLGVEVAGASPGLYKSSTTSVNIGYPFKLNSIANIVGSSKGDQQYPFFYNWQIEGMAQTCNDGSRLPITAFVAPDVTPVISGVDPMYLSTDQPVIVGVSPAGGILTGPGVSGNVFSPVAAGTGIHQLTYTYAFGNCTRTTSLQTEVKFDSSSVQLTDMIQLYNNPSPNPRLYVVTNQATNLEWRIVNSIGQLVKSGRYGTIRGSNMYDFDLSNLSRGVYMLDVRMGNDVQRKVFKLVR
jgi:hypothetical protein